MTLATAMRRSREAFTPAQNLAARLAVLAGQPGDPDSEKWGQLMAQFEAVENSARRATGWRGCVFGRDSHCPDSLPVRCQACAGGPSPDPLKVISQRVDVDAQGQQWDVWEVQI